MARQTFLSPDGDAVAIRTDADPDAYNAYAVMHVMHGGAWSGPREVDGWTDITPD
ncbi:MAG: hypothetical protein WCO97_04895 [bacterium]